MFGIRGTLDVDDGQFEGMAITFRIMRLSGLWRMLLDRALKADGMSIATMRPLAYLMMMPEGTCQRDLASAMNTDTSALVRVLDLLEDTGLVERVSDEHDRRSKRLYISELGKAKSVRFREIASDLEARLCANISPQESSQVIDVMDLMLKSAEDCLVD